MTLNRRQLFRLVGAGAALSSLANMSFYQRSFIFVLITMPPLPCPRGEKKGH